MRADRLDSKLLALSVATLIFGTALASNMAFKLNYLVQKSSAGTPPGTATKSAGGGCTTCGNWISFPFQGQFAGLRNFAICQSNPNFAFVAQPGTSTGLGDGTVPNFANIDSLITTSCSLTAATTPNPVYQPNAATRVILKATAPGDVQYIIVGADGPGTQQLIRKSSTAVPPGTGTKSAGGGCVTCGNWVQLPYHATAARQFDICLENTNFGFVSQPGTSSGLGNSTLVFMNNVDSLITTSCSLTAATTPNPLVQIGRPVRIILKASAPGDILWSPAHF